MQNENRGCGKRRLPSIQRGALKPAKLAGLSFFVLQSAF
jgi:hypothetical protein